MLLLRREVGFRRTDGAGDHDLRGCWRHCGAGEQGAGANGNGDDAHS